MKNKLMIISLAFILIISLSMVNASENDLDAISINGNDLNSISISESDLDDISLGESNPDSISIDENSLDDSAVAATQEGSAADESLAESPDEPSEEADNFTSLKSIISSGTKVQLTKDYIMQPGEDPIELDRIISIDGQGHTIDANGLNRIFIIKNLRVSLRNITLINGKSEYGGAIFCDAKNFILENVSFINCTAIGDEGNSAYGGAIYWNKSGGLMDGCYFEDCKVYNGEGGTIYWAADSGTIQNTRILNSTVYNTGDALNNGSFAISWRGNSGNILNTSITNPKKTGECARPYAVDFISNGGLIENLTITGQMEGYSVYCSNLPLEDSISNLDANLPMFKFTPEITLSGNIFTANPVKSGNVTYIVDEGDAKTAAVDENGHFSCDVDFQGMHMLKVVYQENIFYNSVTKIFAVGNGSEKLSSTFTELNNLIYFADSVLDLDKDFIFNSDIDSRFSNGILISKGLTINGNGHSIDANSSAKNIFKTTGNIVINNVTFRNTRFDGEGKVISAESPIEINACNFYDNDVAIDLRADNSKVNGSIFTGNNLSAILINSNNNHISYSLFDDNGDHDISASSDQTAYLEYNAFISSSPFNNIACENIGSNWYGSNALPEFIESDSNFLNASLDYALEDNVLRVKVIFKDSLSGTIIEVPWSRPVSYLISYKSIDGNDSNEYSSKNVIGDNLNGVLLEGVANGFIINAFIDNQRLASGANFWYVDGSADSDGMGTEDSPFKKLKSAIDAAADGDTILIAPGNYKGTQSNVDLVISKALTLERWGLDGESIFDGENRYKIFTINSNVVLSDLIFRNAHTVWNGGALSISSDSVIFNCIFADNKADKWGGSIYSNSGESSIINCQFINSTSSLGGGAIVAEGANLNISDSVFSQNNAPLAGAIFVNLTSNVNVMNSSFINNSALTYGGAIRFDSFGNVYDSIFINNSAILGGGAVYVFRDYHNVEGCLFINNSAVEGGAILSLISLLNVADSSFINNSASSFGGAIKSHMGNFVSINSVFIDNDAYYDGGAVYIYKGENSISDSFFRGNIAGYGGGAVHLLAGTLTMNNSIMENNISAESNGFVDTVYINPFIDLGDYALIVANTSNFNGTIPSYFNLLDEGWDTAVKVQVGGTCWDYATIAMVETAVKKATGVELDLSEGNVKNLLSKYSIYGENIMASSGREGYLACIYLLSSLGPVLESVDPTIDYQYSPLLMNDVIHVSNIPFASRNSPLDNDEIKKAIMKYGAVKMGFHVGNAFNGYNFYENESTDVNHAVAIVGWDDNYSKDNFCEGCPGDGAWIIRNSWGSGVGNGSGYYYISYYDTSIADDFNYVIFNDTIRYNRAYQYDGGIFTMRDANSSESWYKNIYKSVKDEGLTAFSTFFNNATEWEVFVYVNGELKHSQKGSSISQGYFTYNFDKVIPVHKGDEFAVAVHVNGSKFPAINKNLFNTLTCGEGCSYYSKDGIVWKDLDGFDDGSLAASLKVYTRNLSPSIVKIEDIDNVTYSNPIIIDFNVENRTAVSYVITKGDERIIEVLNASGDEIILNALAAGNYTVTIFNGADYDFMPSLASSNFSVYKGITSVRIVDMGSAVYGKNIDIHSMISNRTSAYYEIRTLSGEKVFDSVMETDDISIPPVLSPGKYIITICNEENENYTESSASAELDVDKYDPILVIDAVDVTYPNDVVITVRTDISGTYAIKIGDSIKELNLMSDEPQSVVFKGLAPDSYTFELIYNGTENYKEIDRNINLQVFKASSMIRIENLIDGLYNTSAPSFDVTISNETSARYELIKDDVIIKSGSFAELNDGVYNADGGICSIKIIIGGDLSNLNSGAYLIRIMNEENGTHNSSECSASFEVRKIDVASDELDENIEITYGENVSIAVSYENVLASVIGYEDASVSLEDGSIIVTGLDAGSYRINVTYMGDENHNDVTRIISLAVKKAQSSFKAEDIKLEIVNQSIAVHTSSEDCVKLIMKVYAKDGKLVLNRTLNANESIGSLNLGAGDYSIFISLVKDSNHESFTKEYSVSIPHIPKIANFTLKTNVYYLEKNPISVRVVDENSNPMAGYAVNFKLDNRVFKVKTDKNGFASISPVLKPGNHNVIVEVADSKKSSKISVKHIINAKATTKVSKSAAKTAIPIKLLGEKSNLSKKITVKYLGKTKINVNFGTNAKNQKVTFRFNGKTYAIKVNKKGKGVLKLSKAAAKKLKKGKKYKGTVKYIGPKPYKSVKVKVRFNNKNYYVKTNTEGIAKFNIAKKMIKKFKKGMTVKYVIYYKNDQLTRAVKIA